MQITLLQGLGGRNLSPLEAGRVIMRCEERIGRKFTEKELHAGKMAPYLLPEDFDDLPKVLTCVLTTIFPSNNRFLCL
jgi:hypothetical protein